ncbi:MULTISPECIES: DUF1289 domain-containing protein [unclassified Shewanella]|uniref:DUF1289 domain-containing protein n=1 Tax=unclassified Shewanella TaxID=196818 RepID=UPI001BB93A55|nr:MULTISPECIES: DUF1289 domain-containing protein [unclassified Shewanella]GIU11893.1 DUF1289 domain-containing protein [Shewanella sp. MBTL60-112-B1]GIU31936.1 DUF1289 domain-containing protein [Shewanella sp. MBTL60-112-B2]
MEQLEFFEIPSPCIGVCQSDARGYCKGCLRNRNERFNWLEFSDAQKYDVIRLCKQRKRRRQLALLKAKKAQVLDERAKANTRLDFGNELTAETKDNLGEFKLD